MVAHVGRDTLIQFCIANEDADPASLVFLDLGMTRGRTLEDAWTTADVTGDRSPAYTRQRLVTFKDVNAEIDGVSYDDAVHNQLLLKQHAAAPGAGTNNQPKAWLRFIFPSHTRTGPFIVSNMSEAEPYDEGATWNMSFESNGPCDFILN